MKKKILLFLFVFLSFILLCYPLFLQKTFGNVSFEQVIFHLVNPLKGTDIRLYYKGFGYAFFLPLFLTFLYMYPSWFVPKKFKGKIGKWQKSKWQARCSILLFISSIVFQFYVLHIYQWYYGRMHPTTLFRDHYIEQKSEDITFNEKRNAIIIYLESMEKTYADTTVFDKNYIPELTKLADQNVSFDRFYQFPGTQWTIAGLVNGMCGIPLRIPMNGVRLDLFKTFLPSAVCVPEILKDHGYNTGIIIGSQLKFSGLDNLVSQHGFDKYWGSKEIQKEKGDMSIKERGHGWGYNDDAMFEFAKEKITLAANENKPFFYVLMTIDTHYPNAYFNPNICVHKENNFTDIASCSSALVNRFVDWIKAQPFAKDTAIVIVGDHITHGNDVYDTMSKTQNRQVINIFMNGSKKPIKETGRHFGTFDFAPSILSFMGANLPKDAFGLGRDLFSATPTLTESMSVEEMGTELGKYSPEYQKFFLPRAGKTKQ